LELKLYKRIILTLGLLFAPSVYANSYGLYDFSNVRYEHSKNTTDVKSIASITKLFTAYAVIMSGVDLDEKVKVQGRAGGRFARGAYLERSELMRAMLMSSDNLAAETLAHAHPGGYEQFIKDINWHLGLNGFKETKIVDATGLLAGNVSTVDELKEFLFILRRIDIIKFYSSEKSYFIKYLPPKSKRTITIQLKNTNPQIFNYDSIVLTKTGFTNAAGRCLAMLVEKNGVLYAMVTLGNKDVKQRSGVINDMFNIYVNHD
jgi:D-alanyl-D-alanine endopeptidase (penicillin-binding protein 7)